MKNKCAVLINSCDLYQEAWEPFFSLFRKYWSTCNFNVYLSTESEQRVPDGVLQLNTGFGSWSKRLHRALEMIDEEYVIVLLEDFFFQKEVNTAEIDLCIQRLGKDPSIAVFYFNRITGFTKKSLKFPSYYEMDGHESQRYMFNCQAAIWRKSVLLAATTCEYSPWEFENVGYVNAAQWLKEMKYFCSINTRYDAIRKDDVFGYILVREAGYGIWRSCWLWNNKKLFKKEGINVKFIRLKKMSKFSYKMGFFKKKIKSIIGKIIMRLK